MSFLQNFNALGQIANQTSPQSSQTFTYDPSDRLTTVADTYSGACTTRVYAFDTDSNRTSLKAYPGTGTGGATCSTSTTPATTSFTYDQADRLTSDTSGSYTYDNLGRTANIPATDAQGIGAHASVTGAATVGYYANNLVATQQQGATTVSFSLDPEHNRVSSQTEGATTTTNHYTSDSDSPAWSSTGASTWTRNLAGTDGGLAVTTDQSGAVTLQLSNPHGDITATCVDSSSATGTSSYHESTEYGVQRNASAAYTTYSYLGTAQRSASNLAGLVGMGLRLLSPATGALISPDPVDGSGGGTSYEYAGADPVNVRDLNGQSSRITCDARVHEAHRSTGQARKGFVGISGKADWECFHSGTNTYARMAEMRLTVELFFCDFFGDQCLHVGRDGVDNTGGKKHKPYRFGTAKFDGCVAGYWITRAVVYAEAPPGYHLEYGTVHAAKTATPRPIEKCF